MVMQRRNRWLALALGILASGCNAILGNEVHELAITVEPDAGDQTATEGGVGSDAGDQDATSPSNDVGTSLEGSAEDSAQPVEAAPVCNPNATECRNQSVYLCTPTGQWIEALRCPNACFNGACTGSCVPATTGCSVLTPQTCGPDGQWMNGTPCEFLCTDGKCTGMCIPGSTAPCGSADTCNASAVKTCDDKGQLGACPQVTASCTAVPATWDPVAVSTSACPAGFGNGRAFYTDATGADYTCTCGCSGTQSCSGSTTLNEYVGAGCTGAPTPHTIAVTPNCLVGNYGNIFHTNSYALSNFVYAPAPACSAVPTATVKPPVVAPSVIVCAADTTCPTGACLESSQTASLCVKKAGTNACPAGYPARTLASSAYDDSRFCDTCSCGSTLACNATGVILDNAGNCPPMAAMYSMVGTTSCASGNADYPINWVKAKAAPTGDGTCAQTAPSTPKGTVTLRDAEIVTICCK
jgi:hypothetical protein